MASRPKVHTCRHESLGMRACYTQRPLSISRRLCSRILEPYVVYADNQSNRVVVAEPTLLPRIVQFEFCSFRQFQPKQLSRLCWALGAWHGQGIVLSGSGLFAARALKQAGKHPKEYTAKELAQVGRVGYERSKKEGFLAVN